MKTPKSTTRDRYRALGALADLTGDSLEPVGVGYWGLASGLPTIRFADAALDLVEAGSVCLHERTPGMAAVVAL